MDVNEIKDLLQCIASLDLGEVMIENSLIKLCVKKKSVFLSDDGQRGATDFFPPLKEASDQYVSNTLNFDNSCTIAKKKHSINSPMVGTFYVTNGKDKEPFIKVGDSIKRGQIACIIESMKIFNDIESEFSGKIIEILVENESPVVYGQQLFIIESDE